MIIPVLGYIVRNNTVQMVIDHDASGVPYVAADGVVVDGDAMASKGFAQVLLDVTEYRGGVSASEPG